ncbi:MAG: hypothetical protein AAFU85_13865 [Planctomycetota bacterium]
MSYNPYQAPLSVPSGDGFPGDPDRLLKIAKAQRSVNLALLMYLGLIPINVGISLAGEVASWVGFALILYILVMLVFGAVSVFRLASVLRGRGLAILYLVGMIIPLIGAILLLSLSSRATRELRAAGIKVGLLGANPADVAR